MKDYKEMADSVFKKIEIYEEKEKKQRAKLVKLTSVISAFALLVSGGIVFKLYSIENEKRNEMELCAVNEKCIDDSKLMKKIVEKENRKIAVVDTKEMKEEAAPKELEPFAMEKQGGEAKSLKRPEVSEEKRENLDKIGEEKERQAEVGEMRRFAENSEESENKAKTGNKKESFERKMRILPEENKLVLNKGGDWISKCNVPTVEAELKGEDVVNLDKEGLNSYFGRKVFPKVPEDLEEWEVPSYQVYKKDGGKGETYFDSQVLNYSDKSFKRSVNLELSKFESGVGCAYAPKTGEFQASVIQGKKVEVFKHEGGIFSADFKVGKVVFRLVTTGLKEEEMLLVLESLLE